MSEIDQVRQQLRQERARQLREENEAAIEELERQRREREFLEEMGQPVPERREWQLPEVEPPPRERKRDTSPVDWSSVIDQRIGAEHAFMAQLLAELIATLTDRQEKAIEDAVRPLQSELGQMKGDAAQQKVAFCELRVALNEQLAADHGKTIDLPQLPLRSRAN
ncbi:hypothetical protein [Bradyrhizobium sp. BWC-3-1]|uniref:hypothetical protein n=1 Tax=Bradyrhizobium sp. BWC-3-1 TaxID=3080012 RepID=UPI00293EDFE7|nr:hypothetical protein [Bradyrhizobium sp. BWC-3-1]WOH60930.1 hypothetical protein RX329_12830 [Bradyrhizobium sp. BWC-3-1]